jgi:hypothetical protein
MTRPRDLVRRLTGISTPLGGVSWQPEPSESDAANRVLAFLEDRRVLYEAYSWEVPSQCVDSVLEIRRMLTAEIGALSPSSPLAANLRAITAAGRKFLRSTGVRDNEPSIATPYGLHRWGFETALGELRAVVGIHVALIAERHSLPVPRQLQGILPESPD